jgi:GTPase SAR1 family protein
MSEEFEVFKVVMLGEAGVGKTCIVNRYLKD